MLSIAMVCGCASGPSTEPPQPTELRVPLPRDIVSLDPLEAHEVVTLNVVRQLYDGLVDHDPRTFEVVPALAESWSVSPDGCTYDFALRPDARFIDDPCFAGGKGRAITAEDVRYSIERGLQSFRDSGVEELPAIVGNEELHSGAGHAAGISVASPRRIAIQLVRPDPTLLHWLADPSCRVVPREAVERYGDLRTHPVGSGPFRLLSWEPLGGILLAKNRGYWRTDSAGVRLPYVDALRFVPHRTGTEYRLLAEGELDMVYSYSRPVERGPGVAASSALGEQEFFVPRLNTIMIRFDYRSRHLVVRDRRLREALCFASPRPVGTAHVAAKGLFPPELPGFAPEFPGQRTDSLRAVQLLAEAGYPGGRNLPMFRLAWPEWDAGIGQGMADAYRRIGLHVTVDIYPARDYRRAIEAGSADLFRDGWIADYPDPLTFLKTFRTGASANHGAYSNPVYDRRLDHYVAERDPHLRSVEARALERLLVEDIAAVFLHHEREHQIVSGRVTDWEPNCTNPLNACHYESVHIVDPRRRARR